MTETLEEKNLRIRNQYGNLDAALSAKCKEWLKGCINAPPFSPQECSDCTDAFLRSIVNASIAFEEAK